MVSVLMAACPGSRLLFVALAGYKQLLRSTARAALPLNGTQAETAVRAGATTGPFWLSM